MPTSKYTTPLAGSIAKRSCMLTFIYTSVDTTSIYLFCCCCCFFFPEACLHAPSTCSCEGDVNDNWRAGLWWHLPSARGRRRGCLSSNFIPSLGYLSGDDASSTKQLSGKMEAHQVATVSILKHSLPMCIWWVSWLFHNACEFSLSSQRQIQPFPHCCSHVFATHVLLVTQNSHHITYVRKYTRPSPAVLYCKQ